MLTLICLIIFLTLILKYISIVGRASIKYGIPAYMCYKVAQGTIPTTKR